MSRTKLLSVIKSEIPSIYKVLDWIQTTGTQWIDTGFVPNQDTRVITEISLDTLTSGQFVFCARRNTTEASFCITLPSNNLTVPRTDYNNNRVSTNVSVSVNNWYKIDKNKNLTYINDTLTNTQTYANFNSTISLTLFCGRRLGDMTAIDMMKGKMKYCQVYDNGIMVRNYIPVRRLTDNVAGMYDTITKTFSGNSNSL